MLAPSFNWHAFARGMDMPHVDSLNVTNPDYFKALDQVLNDTSLMI